MDKENEISIILFHVGKQISASQMKAIIKIKSQKIVKINNFLIIKCNWYTHTNKQSFKVLFFIAT